MKVKRKQKHGKNTFNYEETIYNGHSFNMLEIFTK